MTKLASEGNRTHKILSIVVPTKNRPQYAISCIKHLLEIRENDVEFIVYDNSSDETLKVELVKLPPDPRLKYIRDSDTIDVVENFERATRHAQGEYITHLGDDDGVSLEIVKCTRLAQRLQAEAVVCKNPAFYFWPGHRFYYYGNLYASSISFKLPSGKYRWMSAISALTKCLSHGGQDFGALPKSYHGIVKRSALLKVAERCGRYFPGPSPDLAGGAALACCITNYIELDFPFIIVGTSSVSTAGLGSRKAHIGRLEDWPHLPSFALRNWSTIVPRFFSGRTIWAEDVIQGLYASQRLDLIEKFSKEALYGYCLACHLDQWKAIAETWRKNTKSQALPQRFLGVAYIAFYYASYQIRRVGSIVAVIRQLAGSCLIRDVKSIEGAGRILQEKTLGVLKDEYLASSSR
jgi:glycosyltransferase involved in cell wall biosynthesis